MKFQLHYLIHALYNVEEGRSIIKQSRALDWIAAVCASCKQDFSFGPLNSNSPGESNQTFMLNHETIRMESANKRAGCPISPSLLKPSPGHLTLLFTRPRMDKKLMDIPRRTKGSELDPERKREKERESERAVCKFLGWVRRKRSLALGRVCIRRAFAAITTFRPSSPDCRRLLRLTFLGVISVVEVPLPSFAVSSSVMQPLRDLPLNHNASEPNYRNALYTDVQRAATFCDNEKMIIRRDGRVLRARVEIVIAVYDGIKCITE